MKISELLRTPTNWARADGPHGRIVLSSRVRLARNLAGVPFPGWAKKNERLKILERIRPVVEALPELKNAFSTTMDNLAAIDKQVLVERHLVSREHAAKNVGSGVVIHPRESISVMINEEDHLRMQALRAGLQLKEVHQVIDHLDTALENQLDFAYSPRYGFLTACPTNVGSGMRASAMLHLPALVLSEQVNQVIQAANKLGLAVRGLYGEGTEALGNVFQVSNQTTLGEREPELIERLTKVILQVVEHEENARVALLEKKPHLVYDQIGRAFGVLSNAHTVTSKEALNLLSLLRMGVDLQLLPEGVRGVVDELLISAQPAHVQKAAERKLNAEERDIFRADLIRQRLADVARPRRDRPPVVPEPDGDPVE
ncbi:protein arginine kinase [bacterium]|nr:protein arginine kinase [bacterium]